MIDIRGKTHIGRRALNEDRFVADAGWGIALVSDGMGGRDAGEIAAGLVAMGVVDRLDEGLSLEEAVAGADEDVRRAAGDGTGKPGMGATLVLAQFEGYDFRVAWIGDSRAYLWDGELRQITRDHSEVERLIASGEATPQDAGNRNNKHLITRAMGLSDLRAEDVPTLQGTLCRGQQLLLCSDGLSDMLAGTEIAGVLATDATPEDKLETLVGRAVEAGGADNITAVLVTADDDAPETAAPLPAVSIARPDGSTEYYGPGE
ncbi:protein phosphatase [Salinisphaera sp. PC39]|uniref:PP2C family protein-serine/threonine phosphatase n=1 Tax=Salinisphaera sp. PC39 TaxID=1304156 RepID=UPI003342CAC2